MQPFHHLPDIPLVDGRVNFILDQCRGKRVLHLGCVDAGLLADRYARGELLHQKLAAVSADLWGVDVDAPGIAFMQGQGFPQLVVGDVCDLATFARLGDVRFDVILASEVVEHLLNPGLFFDAVKTVMAPGHTTLIVTVPNAFRISTLLWLRHGVEYVHPDHNYWFSYYTATNLMQKCGFAVDAVFMYTHEKRVGLSRPVRRLLGQRQSAGAPAAAGDAGDKATAVTTAGSRSALYLRTLPRRLLAAAFFHNGPFWGDGVIVIARLPVHGPATT